MEERLTSPVSVEAPSAADCNDEYGLLNDLNFFYYIIKSSSQGVAYRPDSSVVERSLRVRKVVGSNPGRVKPKDVKIWYQ